MAASEQPYGFPFAPYSIQLSLMDHLKDQLEKGNVTVVESPTGTGKSLSLLCSSLTHLATSASSSRLQALSSLRLELENAQEPDWVIQAELRRMEDELDGKERELADRLGRIRQKEKERIRLEELGGAAAGKTFGPAFKRKKLSHESSSSGSGGPRITIGGSSSTSGEDQFAPTTMEGEEDDEEDEESPYLKALDAKFGRNKFGQQEEEEEMPDVPKIIYASRTHSQLSQIVSEIAKTTFASSPTTSSSTTTATTTTTTTTPVRVLPIGSRQNLCINSRAREKSKGNSEALNDICKDLQAGKGKKTKKKPIAGGAGKREEEEEDDGSRCEFMPKPGERGKMPEFRDRALAEIGDIEDLAELGRQLGCCPYYGAREAIKPAQVVLLPYNLLLQPSAREALGLSVKGNTVIVDEAHNLIDSVLSIHSCSITTSALANLRAAVLTYFNKFKSRLKGTNQQMLKQLVVVLRALAKAGEEWLVEEGEGEKWVKDLASKDAPGQQQQQQQEKKQRMCMPAQFVGMMKGLDQVNLRLLDQYLKESGLARKIGGYVEYLAELATAQDRAAARSNATREMHALQSFLVACTNPNKDGRVLLTGSRVKVIGKDGKEEIKMVATFKYMLLNPSEAFRDVVEEAKAVVLAGGTMTPISDFQKQMFPYLEPDRFTTMSCGHIVDPSHVLTLALGSGPTGKRLNLKFENQGKPEILDELGSAIVNIATRTQKGTVVFLTSYSFLEKAKARWSLSSASAAGSVLSRLEKKAKVFWEPKEAKEVEVVLREYSASAESGAVLFAVVGARLSEGINFSNDLARSVVICGIPYPNRGSTELKERIKYLDSLPGAKTGGGASAGDVFYENLAFRAVNQSIGRAIRHKMDWASIILIDERYAFANSISKLPTWLGSNVQKPQKWSEVEKLMVSFHTGRRKAQLPINGS